MSRAEDYLTAVTAETIDRRDPETYALLRAIANAWLEAEAGLPSEVEANRWSKVCNAAERVVGL